jgi:exopolysaccharide biosynthesis polyprenyl glycosylphosphotransferase
VSARVARPGLEGATRERAVLVDTAPTRSPVAPAYQRLGVARRRGVSPSYLLALSDGIAVLVALAVVAASSPWSPPGTGAHRQLAFIAVMGAVTLFAFQILGVHAGTPNQVVPSAVQELGRGALGVCLSVLFLLSMDVLIGGAGKAVLVPKNVLLGGLLIVVCMPGARAVGLALCERLGGRRQRVVVVGTGTIAADVAARLNRARLVDFVGYLDDEPVKDQPVIGRLSDLATICRREAVDRIVVAFSKAHPEAVAANLRQVGSLAAITVVPRYFDITGWEAKIGDLGGLPTVNLGSRPGVTAGAVKRAMDVVGATIGLLAALPLLAVAAVAVRLSSPGPVLFRQPRLGRSRQPFEVLKLRTMREPTPLSTGAAHHDPLSFTPTDEQRVTRVGGVLRRTGIDELPQLLNVLKGDMSLVGPRPFIELECRDFPAWAEERFTMRPGMTGLWQVCGQHELRMEELHRLDAQYVSSWSLRYDLRILLRTPGRLLQGGGDRTSFRGSHERRGRSG